MNCVGAITHCKVLYTAAHDTGIEPADRAVFHRTYYLKNRINGRLTEGKDTDRIRFFCFFTVVTVLFIGINKLLISDPYSWLHTTHARAEAGGEVAEGEVIVYLSRVLIVYLAVTGAADRE